MTTSALPGISQNFSIPFYLGSRFSTSLAQDQRITKLSEEYLEESLLELKWELGLELFDQLSLKEKIFILETAGSVDFGKPIDLDEVASDIANYDR